MSTYFLESVKRQMERDLRNLRQGDWIVAEYEWEFSRLLRCVPFVVRDDEDKACIFEMGLRLSIFRFVQSSNLQTYREVVNCALILEKDAEALQERRKSFDKGKEKRLAAEVVARRTLGGRRSTRGASLENVALLRSEEDLIVADLHIV